LKFIQLLEKQDNRGVALVMFLFQKLHFYYKYQKLI
jgi:hypothetical protein